MSTYKPYFFLKNSLLYKQFFEAFLFPPPYSLYQF